MHEAHRPPIIISYQCAPEKSLYFPVSRKTGLNQYYLSDYCLFESPMLDCYSKFTNMYACMANSMMFSIQFCTSQTNCRDWIGRLIVGYHICCFYQFQSRINRCKHLVDLSLLKALCICTCMLIVQYHYEDSIIYFITDLTF